MSETKQTEPQTLQELLALSCAPAGMSVLDLTERFDYDLAIATLDPERYERWERHDFGTPERNEWARLTHAFVLREAARRNGSGEH